MNTLYGLCVETAAMMLKFALDLQWYIVGGQMLEPHRPIDYMWLRCMGELRWLEDGPGKDRT